MSSGGPPLIPGGPPPMPGDKHVPGGHRKSTFEDVAADTLDAERARRAQAIIRGWLARKGFCLQSQKPLIKPGTVGPGIFLPIRDMDLFNVDIEWLVGGDYRRLPDDDTFCDVLAKVGVPNMTRASFGKLKGFKQKRYLDILAEVSDVQYTFPHEDVHSAQTGEALPWTDCVGVERSSVGSEGVLFVEFPHKEAVVVKAPSRVASEMLGTIICKKLGVRCPQMRLVKRSSDEGQAIFNALVVADRGRPPAERRVSAMLSKRPAFLVIEYLQAYELADLGVKRPLEGWGARVLNLPEGLSEHGRSVLSDLGSLIAFDVLVNNYDRLPCIWMNQGNPGNVMFDVAEDSVISIDNMMTCIQSNTSDPIGIKLYSEYMARARSMCEAVACRPDEEHPDFKRVRELLHKGCPEGHGWPGLGLDIGPAGTAAVQDGFLQTVQSLVYGTDGTQGGISRAWLEEQAQALFDAISDHLPSTGEGRTCKAESSYGFECINLDFMAEIIEIYSQALEQAEPDKQSASPCTEDQQHASEPPTTLLMSQSTGGGRGGDDICISSAGIGQAKIVATQEQTAQFIEKLQLACQQRKAREDAVTRCNEQLRQNLHRVRQRASVSKAQTQTFPLDHLLADERDKWPLQVLDDPANRERWLSDSDFLKIFGIDRETFGKLQLWKRRSLKKEKGLF